MRGTAKAFLKLQEKRLENEKAQERRTTTKTSSTPPAENEAAAASTSGSVSEEVRQTRGAVVDSQGKVETQSGSEVRCVEMLSRG